MAVTVVGSVAFDALETPYGRRHRILGGAATHFSLAASFFTDVRVVGVVGDDFGPEQLAVFDRHGVDTSDLARVDGERSFFWSGRYDAEMQNAETIDTQLNVLATFDPQLSPAARDCSVLFLANMQPDVQRRVREQCPRAFAVGLDSMNYWISSARDSLVEAIRLADVVVLNDAEVRMFTDEPNPAVAVRRIRELGPRVVAVKQGRYGAALFTDDGFFAVPGYPLELVVDPTGAGDAFAGGFFGYLDRHAGAELSDNTLRCAAVYGSVMASFTIESFGSERLAGLTLAEIEARFEDFGRMTRFDGQPAALRSAGG
ncbi:MAG TPA: PfkB family carbohydrate kinase [Gaiellales bacterium]|nr:PfkB family carbohydrate kinase [Gaiellales bacterium]